MAESLFRTRWRTQLAWTSFLCLGATACTLSRPLTTSTPLAPAPPADQQTFETQSRPVVPAAHVTTSSPPTAPYPSVMPAPEVPEAAVEPLPEPDDPFFGRDSLDLDELIELVHERNPSLQAMYAAWEAAAARFPQEVSLDDPMLDFMLAPASFGSGSNVPESWSVEASQKLPWFGKRDFRGRVASANASAAALDADDLRLQLSLSTRVAFSDFVLATQTLELNALEKKLLEELRSVARIIYETNQTPQQDVLQANVEYAEVLRRKIEFTRGQRLSIARINTLLHRDPLAPLPVPRNPASLTTPLPAEVQLLETAIQVRPDLAAQASRIAAEQAAYCLAVKEFHPDVELYGRHDRMWLDSEQQNSIGLKLNLPAQRRRRWAALQEAQARLAKAQAEYQARESQIRLEVATAYQRLNEARESERLYREEIIKAAEQNVTSARAGYESGGVNFLTLVAAQRQLLDFRQKQAEAAAEYQKQLAELERAVGAPL
jgi:cobalt-zinc-cadmium efflux system outer membrane protein